MRLYKFLFEARNPIKPDNAVINSNNEAFGVAFKVDDIAFRFMAEVDYKDEDMTGGKIVFDANKQTNQLNLNNAVITGIIWDNISGALGEFLKLHKPEVFGFTQGYEAITKLYDSIRFQREIDKWHRYYFVKKGIIKGKTCWIYGPR